MVISAHARSSLLPSSLLLLLGSCDVAGHLPLPTEIDPVYSTPPSLNFFRLSAAE